MKGTLPLLRRAALAGFWCGAWALPMRGQTDQAAARYAATITEAGLRSHLEVLANDSLEGRELGTPGEKKAAAYIVEQFRSFGIVPIPHARERGLLADGFRQQFPVERVRMGGLSMRVAGKEFTFGKDLLYFQEALIHALKVPEVMLLGPVTAGGTRLGGGSKVVMYWAAGNTGLMEGKDLQAALSGTGTEVLLVVNDSAGAFMARFGESLLQGRMQLGEGGGQREGKGMQLVVISPDVARYMLQAAGMKEKRALKEAARKRVMVRVPVEFAYANRSERLTGENVLGYVQGTDLRNELVVVSAHYDHVGIIDGEVYNGADDDGSGTSAVLAMAGAFARAKAEGHGPRRSMLFLTVSGEEKGLFGSRWYTDHPVFPLDSTVADLNIDMIGRTDTVYGDSSRYVYVIGSKRLSSELGAVVEEQNAAHVHLGLDYKFDADDDPNRFYYRSDHYNFAKHGIPVAFFFNGVHADYHGAHDEVEKIRFDLLLQRTLLVYYTAWAIANRDQRPALDMGKGN